MTNQTNKQVEKAIIDLIWYTLMYSPDGDNERQQYWSAIEEGLEKDVDKLIKQTKLEARNKALDEVEVMIKKDQDKDGFSNAEYLIEGILSLREE